MAERSFAQEVKKLRLGAGEPFVGEGILAVTKALLQSGVAYVAGYQGSPISHLMDVLADAQDILGEMGVRFETSASEATAAATLGGVGELPAARRCHLQIDSGHQRRLGCAGQPGVGRCHRWRAGHRRRGLRRRLQHHAGTQPRVRDEVADVAARPAAEPAQHRQGGGGRLRAVRGQPHAGDAAAAHPRLPCARALRRQGQSAPGVFAGAGGECAEARRAAHRAAAGELRARAGEDRIALAGGGEVHRAARVERVLCRRQRRCRRDRAGWAVQLDAARDGAARAGRRLRPPARAAVRDERRLPADRPRVEALLCRQARGAAGRGRAAELHRAGHRQRAAPGRPADQADGQGRAADGRGIHAGGAGQGLARLLRRTRTGAVATPRRPRSSRSSPSINTCTRARRGCAPAARNARCSPR